MSRIRPLQGECLCGRNQYIITVPQDATEEAVVYFDESSENRKSQATPLTMWLRVPMPWYTTTITPIYDDETHGDIQKVFEPFNNPTCRRVFCGFCGTHLSFYNFREVEDAKYIHITLGSLVSSDLRALQDLGILPEDVLELDSAGVTGQSTRSAIATHVDTMVSETSAQENETLLLTPLQHGRAGNLTWFQELLEGSPLGRIQSTRRRLHKIDNGVEWEVEIMDDSTEAADTPTGSKRKIGEVEQDEDVTMQPE